MRDVVPEDWHRIHSKLEKGKVESLKHRKKEMCMVSIFFKNMYRKKITAMYCGKIRIWLYYD